MSVCVLTTIEEYTYKVLYRRKREIVIDSLMSIIIGKNKL